MENIENYIALIKTEELLFDAMNNVQAYSDEWLELDSARCIIAKLEEKFR